MHVAQAAKPVVGATDPPNQTDIGVSKMADQNFTLADDLPTVPKVFTFIRVADTPDEEARAQRAVELLKVAPVADWERMTDAEVVTLASEPEFLTDCTPLERELIVRLAARFEWERDQVV